MKIRVYFEVFGLTDKELHNYYNELLKERLVKMEEKATIHNFSRVCKTYYGICSKCPLTHQNNGISVRCNDVLRSEPDKANEIILNWCKEHPIETRQDRFLKMFPNVLRFKNLNIIAIKPCTIDKNYGNKPCTFTCEECEECIKNYWLAEVEE